MVDDAFASKILCQAFAKDEITSEQHSATKKITEEQYEQIRHHLSVQRGNVLIPNTAFINALPHCQERLQMARHPRLGAPAATSGA